jgi:hypothetical protein
MKGDGVFTDVVLSWISFSALPTALVAVLAAPFDLGHMASNIRLRLGEGGSVSLLAPKPYFETDKETT